MDGGIKTATVRPKGRPVRVDGKIKFLVQELDRFHMSIVCISGLVMIFMKWMDLQCFIQVAVFLCLVMLSSVVKELLLFWIP